MASNVFVTFKVDPFYQVFLRSYFKQNEILFEFPRGTDFNILLGFLLMKQPGTPKKYDYGDESLQVLLQYMKHKNVLVYNYISISGNRIFNEKIEDLFKLIFHKHVDQAIHRVGLRKKDAIHSFMEKYNMGDFSTDRLTKSYQRYEDRLVKEYDRWKGAQRQTRHRKRRKKKLSVSPPVSSDV